MDLETLTMKVIQYQLALTYSDIHGPRNLDNEGDVL